MNPVDKAIDAAGSLNELARRLKVEPQVIVNWRKRGVPGKRCRDVEAATKGVVTVHELQPEIFGRAA